MINLTTIQEAVEQMEMFAECEDYYRQNYRVVQPPELLFPAIQTAIATLREQAEREKGCEYCDEDHAEHDCMNGVQTFTNGAYLVLETTEWNDYYDSYNDIRIAVQFCPKCGRKLK